MPDKPQTTAEAIDALKAALLQLGRTLEEEASAVVARFKPLGMKVRHKSCPTCGKDWRLEAGWWKGQSYTLECYDLWHGPDDA